MKESSKRRLVLWRFGPGRVSSFECTGIVLGHGRHGTVMAYDLVPQEHSVFWSQQRILGCMDAFV